MIRACFCGLVLLALAGCKQTPTAISSRPDASELEPYDPLPPVTQVSLHQPEGPAVQPGEQPDEPPQPGRDPQPVEPQAGQLEEPEEIAPPLPEQTLHLYRVIDSVHLTYPLLEVALRERDIAQGEELARWGAFDLELDGFALSQPKGFYEMHRANVQLTQPLYRGGFAFAGYKLGNGNFPSWFGDRETDRGGEFRAGFGLPLLRDRPMDQRRAALLTASLRREAVEPAIQAQVLTFVRAASHAYWSWVAAGQAWQVQRSLLRIAVQRNEGIRRRVELEDLPEIELVDNQRLIALREALLVEAERNLQAEAIQLSLFLRTPDGMPIIPSGDLLPDQFPEAVTPQPEHADQDIQAALQARPELQELALLRAQVNVELEQARNLLMPALNATMLASQDVGAHAKPIRDKKPFELEAGLMWDVPLQRREARGRIRSAQGALAQLAATQQFTENEITVQVQDAVSNLVTAYDRIRITGRNAQLARRMEEAERRKFELGESNILLVNIRESDTVEAALLEIRALATFFMALADYHAALAVDPRQSDVAGDE